MPAAGFGRSYHIEVRTPATLDVIKARLVEERTIGASGETKRKTLVELDGRAAFVHISTHKAIVWRHYLLQLQLRPERRGLVRGCLAASLASSALLTVLVINLQRLIREDVDIEVLGTLLLATPAVVGAFVLRPDEHRLVSRLYLLIRGAMFASCVCAAAAAGVLALKMTASYTTYWLKLLFVASYALTIILCITYWANSNPEPQTLTVGDDDLGPVVVPASGDSAVESRSVEGEHPVGDDPSDALDRAKSRLATQYGPP